MNNTQTLTAGDRAPVDVKAPVGGTGKKNLLDPFGAAQGRPSLLPRRREGTRVEMTPSELVMVQMMPWSNLALEGVQSRTVESPPYEVVTAALGAAIVANEEAGAVKLELVEEKHFFGWFTSTILRATPTGKLFRWPTGSLEHSLGEHITVKAKRVSDVVYDWIGEDKAYAQRYVTNRAMGRMVARKMVARKTVRIEKRALGLFSYTSKSTYYVLPKRSYALADSPSALPAHAYRYVGLRGDDQLEVEIRSGVSRRQEASDCYD